MNHAISDLATVDRRSLHRIVVIFSAITAWLVTLTVLVAVAFTGNGRIPLEAVGPAAAAVFFTLQWVSRRENAGVAMAAGSAIVVATFPTFGDAGNELAASLAVVTMAIVGSLFVHRRLAVFLTATALVLGGVPLFWHGASLDSLSHGVTMGFSFLVGATAFVLLRRRLVTIDQRFRDVFDRAPVALVEQDWSGALDHISALGPKSPNDVKEMLAADEKLVDEVVERIVVVRANAAAAELFATKPDRLLGPLRPDRISLATRTQWAETLVALWAGEESVTLEYEDENFQGRADTWVEVKTIALSTPRSPRVVLALRDVTASRRRSRDLADLVRTKDEFIATVSHELRTPLTAVVGLGNELLAGDDLSEGDRRELLTLVVSQANELSYLVEDLLVGARADIGTVGVEPEPIDLVMEAWAVSATLTSPVQIEADPDSPLAWADPVRVRQVIRNLAVNAERYGGPRRRLLVGPGETGVMVEMRDNGDPLPDADRERIFDPYTRAHDRPGVTMSVGLGLAVSRQLARLMSGDLTYRHDGTESVFSLRLPAVCDSRSRSRRPAFTA